MNIDCSGPDIWVAKKFTFLRSIYNLILIIIFKQIYFQSGKKWLNFQPYLRLFLYFFSKAWEKLISTIPLYYYITQSNVFIFRDQKKLHLNRVEKLSVFRIFVFISSPSKISMQKRRSLRLCNYFSSFFLNWFLSSMSSYLIFQREKMAVVLDKILRENISKCHRKKTHICKRPQKFTHFNNNWNFKSY